jgi:hypothetical protein
VYGCNSDSQLKTNRNVNFFRFPCGQTPEQKSRRAAWEEFCKRKAFKPSLCTRICSLHFAEKSYEPSHSPQFLESFGYTDKTSLRVKPNVYQRLTSLRPALAFLTYLHRHNRRELGDKPRRDNVKRYQYLKDTFTNSFNLTLINSASSMSLFFFIVSQFRILKSG